MLEFRYPRLFLQCDFCYEQWKKKRNLYYYGNKNVALMLVVWSVLKWLNDRDSDICIKVEIKLDNVAKDKFDKILFGNYKEEK